MGTGRTARLLANYALLRNNLQPIVIKSEDRDRYIGGLQNADVGRMLPLAEFILENVLWSLQLGIRAAKGESIREPDDVDKEVELFVRSKRGPEPNKSDLEVLDSVFLMHVHPILDKLENALDSLSQLFRDYLHVSYIEQYQLASHLGQHQSIGGGLFSVSDWERTKREHIVKRGFQLSDDRRIELKKRHKFDDYIGKGNSSFSFGLNLSVTWKLGGEGFSFEADINGTPLTAIGHHIPYSELDSRDAEVDHKVEAICRYMMDEIDSWSQRPE